MYSIIVVKRDDTIQLSVKTMLNGNPWTCSVDVELTDYADFDHAILAGKVKLANQMKSAMEAYFRAEREAIRVAGEARGILEEFGGANLELVKPPSAGKRICRECLKS